MVLGRLSRICQFAGFWGLGAVVGVGLAAPAPALAAEPEVASGLERPASAGDPVCSFVAPICVRPVGQPSPRLVVRALDAGERTLATLAALGIPRPLGVVDLYLDGDGDADDLRVAIDVADLDLRPFDRAGVFAVVPAGPRWARGCALEGAVARAVGFGAAMAIDAGMERGAASAFASYVERLARSCPNDELEGVDAYQVAPERALLPGDAIEADGAQLFAAYLDDAFGHGPPGTVLAGLLTVSSQRTPAGHFTFANEPDLFDALRQNLRLRGSTLDSALLDFAIARAFVGTRDDGLHLEDAARYGDLGRVRVEWSVPFASLPRRFAPASPIEPTGTTYFWLDLAGAPKDAELTFVADWEAGVLFRWALVKLDDKGAEVGRAELAGVYGDTRAEKTIVNLDKLGGILVVGVNAGSVDRSHPFDPDDDHAPSGCTVTLVK
jgi:hypothetical protein